MTARKTVRLLAVSLALLALLMFACAGGDLWHHHNSTASSHCPFCHLGHQVVEQPAPSQRVAALGLLSSLPTPADAEFMPGPVSPRTPTRAPPSA